MEKYRIFQNYQIRYLKLTQQQEKFVLTDFVAPASTASLVRIRVDVVASVIIGSLTIRSGRTSGSITIEQLTSQAATPYLQQVFRSSPPTTTAAGLSLLSREIISRKYNSLQLCRDRNRQRSRTKWVTHNCTVGSCSTYIRCF